MSELGWRRPGPSPRRALGRTGLPVTPVGLGLAALGRPGYVNLGHGRDLDRDYAVTAMEDRAHQVLDAAWDGGVRYVDAARSYGRAEEFLATWLDSRGIPAGALTVASKWGYTYTAGWQVTADRHEVKDHSLATLRRQAAESRSLLGDHLGLYQIHSVTPDSAVLADDDVLDELARLRDQGLAVGLTVSGPAQAEVVKRSVDLRRGGAALFSSVQATWNLLETSAEPALAEAHEAGMGVIVKEALANGRLTGRNTQAADASRLAVLAGLASRRGTTTDSLALAAALDRPWADVVLSGAATVRQLGANLAATAVECSSTSAGTLPEDLAALAEPPQAYWDTRRSLPWN